MGAIEVDEEGAVALCAELVKTRTVYDGEGGGEEKAADLVARTMRAWGWEPRIVEVAPGRPNVIATVDGGGGPGPILGFEGHLDVVTEGDAASWSCDPYGAEVTEGRMYGRGSADMKSGVAAMLYGVRALQQAGPFPGAVRLLALVDEEGMMLGVKHAVDSGALDGVSGVVCCEPEGDEVCPSSKGAIRIRVDLSGRIAHGAMPDQGRNPLPVLGRLLAAIEAYQVELQAAHPVHEHLGTTYLTPTVVRAGRPEQMNTSPAIASLYIDVRTIPGVDHPELIGRVRSDAERLAASAGVVAAVAVIDDRPPVDTAVDDPLVTSVVAAHRIVTGVTPPIGGVPGTTDGTIITRDTGLPTVVYGPGGKWIAHQADEWVAVADIGRYARIYAEAAAAYLTAGAGTTPAASAPAATTPAATTPAASANATNEERP
jgi:succinyl-diaminopimelate desuccinylase